MTALRPVCELILTKGVLPHRAFYPLNPIIFFGGGEVTLTYLSKIQITK